MNNETKQYPSEKTDGQRSNAAAEVAGKRAVLDPYVPRNIVLFSDGTGNSSGKLQKTNVWRLYEALDLGYPVQAAAGAQPGPVQIAYYDNGVGTSSFRLFAALGGVFGFGLARNIRTIYRFLCRNYRPARIDPATGAAIPADRIYAFGFSRGAFTIRLLVSLIVTMGLVEYTGEEELRQRTRDTWRAYRRRFHTSYRFTDLLVALGRAVVRVLIRALRLPGRLLAVARLARHGDSAAARALRDAPLLYLPPGRPAPPVWYREWRAFWWASDDPPPPVQAGPEIEFVGVWDTVAAYGGPFVEITRGIDAWIWPLTMPNYRLSTKVRCARHALSIDDKRDAFEPLLWDEPSERDLTGWNEAEPRLQQVWFAGMHADVGGGYSDESLSYVSLAWMIEHAEAAGVRLLPVLRDRVFTMLNVFGPLHDSRGGAGAFYRYQPRYINGWLHYDLPLAGDRHVRPATQLYRDPTIDRGRYRDNGFLLSPIRLHHSVEERLCSATDGYGPVNLPSEYLLDDGIRGTYAPAVEPPPLPELYELGDRIKLRRFWYFLSVLVFLVIATKPLWDRLQLTTWGTIDARTDTFLIIKAADAVLPAFASWWTSSLGSDPYVSLGLFAILWLFTARGMAHERKMVDASRRLWRTRFLDRPCVQRPELSLRRDTAVPAGDPWKALARAWRSSDGWQRILAFWKWQALPVVLGLAMWLALIYAVLAAITQLALAWQEMRPSQCPGRSSARGDAAASQFGRPVRLDTANPCAALGLSLEPDTTYLVRIETDGAWADRGNPATPAGWTHPGMVAHGTKFFRRVTSAPLFAPILETRVADPAWYLRPFGDGIHMMRPELIRVDNNVWVGTITTGAFTDTQPRRLYAFVNDAVLPVDWVGPDWLGDLRLFPIAGRYRNNAGTAHITLTPLPRR